MKNNLCAVCGGKLTKKKIMVDRIRDGHFYLFDDVLASVCDRCGEIWFSGKTSQWMEQAISNRVKPYKKISIPVYSELTTHSGYKSTDFMKLQNQRHTYSH